MTTRVLVCDDEPDMARLWMEEITAVAPPDRYAFRPVPENGEIKQAIQTLLHRRTALLEGNRQPAEPCLFDGADVLVLDYDLLHVDDNNTRYTGEGVARLARAFSECGIVVVLNQYLGAQFDLGLRGHLESFADLNLDAELLKRPGLWSEASSDEFRPWHWPVLHEAFARFSERTNYLLGEGRLREPVLEVLGLTEANGGRLSDTAFGFLAPGALEFGELAGMTFEDFVRGTSGAVNARDGSVLVDHDDPAAARIAASRVAKWLEREVLGPQDVLLDIPHLLQRAPYLLKGDIADLAVWNAACRGDRSVVSDIVPPEAWFAADDWLARPALWWSVLEISADVRKARATFDFATVPDFVFLEDASRFGPLDQATEFRAGFHNAFDRRYATIFDGIAYAPRRRFAFGG